MISATWCNYRSIYIPVYSQCWFQNAVLNLITTRRVNYSILQHSYNRIILYNIWYLQHDATPVLISKCCIELIASFCIIFDICNMMQLPFYIYSYSQYWFHAMLYCSIYTTLSSIIESFCIIFDIRNMMQLPFYI